MSHDFDPLRTPVAVEQIWLAVAEEEIFVKALEKSRGEKTVHAAIADGMSAVDAFAKYGIM